MVETITDMKSTRSSGFCYDSASNRLAYRANRWTNCQNREKWTRLLAVCAKKKWRVLAVRATVVRPLAYHGRHSVICQLMLPNQQLRVTDPDPATSLESLRIRIHPINSNKL
jgi:hypothetical protein